VISTDYKIEAVFANVPFELTRWDADPLVLLENLTGLVYAPTTTVSPRAPAPQTTTFRVLVVRAEPSNYKGTVPSGTALLAVLANTIPANAATAIDIRLLSSEAGAHGRPTAKALQDEVMYRPPAILFYLGHGDLLAGGGGAPPSPVLLIEHEDGRQDELPAAALRQLFKTQPVPLVVLAGCLTGAAGAAIAGPERLRFAQSMAQFLVSGEGGVTVAIGMRYKLDTDDATRFLERLFRGLVITAPGHVDLAVKEARATMYGDKPNELGWAAPIVYRRLTLEPLFPELRPNEHPATPVLVTTVDPEADAARGQLSVLWSNLATLPADPPAATLAMFASFERAIDAATRARIAARASIGILPQLVQPDQRFASFALARPGTRHRVSLELTAGISVRELAFDLTLRGGGRWVADLLAGTAKAQGFKAYVNHDDPQLLSVHIRRAGIGTFVAGVFFEADVELPSTGPAVVEISVTYAESDPRQYLAGWIAGVVVQPG
jgi:hypothetical protein